GCRAGRRERFEIRETAYTARCLERQLRPFGRAAPIERKIGARERAVAVDVGAQYVPKPLPRVPFDCLGQAQRRRARPAVCGHECNVFGVEADVEAQGEPLGTELLEPAGDALGLRDGEAADDDSVGDGQGAPQAVLVADAAAELYVEVVG